MKKILPALLVTLLFSGCNSLQKKEQLLTASGFRTLSPSTPAQVAHLKSLPQGRITPITKNGRTLFLLADSKRSLLWVGNQSQYQAYKLLRLNKQLSEDQRATKDLNADASAEWNAWGGLDSPISNTYF
jgi:outer membrane murein-binding lipoprotein Lpp